MKLWKYDPVLCTVREVVGGEWPDKDSEGDTCYSNTHFAKEDAAWEALKRDVDARVLFAGQQVRQLAAQMREVEAAAAQATVAFRVFSENYQARQREVARG